MVNILLLSNQTNNITDHDDSVPAKLNVKVDDWDPARDYHIIPEANKSWNLAMDEYRCVASTSPQVQVHDLLF